MGVKFCTNEIWENLQSGYNFLKCNYSPISTYVACKFTHPTYYNKDSLVQGFREMIDDELASDNTDS